MLTKRPKRVYEFDPFRLDPDEQTLTREGQPVPLPPKIFDILKLLVEDSGHLLGKDELMKAVWPDSFVEEGNLTRNISTLRTALGEKPDEHQYIETVPKRGYRFIAKVREVNEVTDEVTSSSKLTEGDETNENQSAVVNQAAVSVDRSPRLRYSMSTQTLSVFLIGALGIAGLVYAIVFRNGGKAASSPVIRSLAVLPLKSLDKKDDDYVGIGLADTIITRVSRIDDLTVSPSGAVKKYISQEVSPVETGKELNVDAILEGTMQRANNQWRLNFNLLRTQDGMSLWSQTYDIDPSDVFGMEDRVSEQVARGLSLKLRPQTPGTTRPIKPEALEYYWRAKPHTWQQNNEDNLATIDLLEHAVSIDPNFAAAYAELASAYTIRAVTVRPLEVEWEEKASAAVNKALSFEPDLAETHIAKGQLLWRSGAFAHEKAIQEFRRAITLNPTLEEAHHLLANVYNHIGLLDKGREEIQKAVELNPQNTGARFRVGVNLLYQCKYEEALAAFGDSSKFNPELWGFQTAWALFQLERRDEATARIEATLKAFPDDEGGTLTSMGALLAASAGDERKAEQKIKKAIELGHGYQQGSVPRRATHFHHTAYAIASAYALLNKPGPAVDWLQDAADDGFPCYPLFEKDPNLNNLRKDQRFVKLMARLKEQWEHFKATL